jgi:DNA recombination protein RmuC
MLTIVLTLAVLGGIGALAYWLPRALAMLRVDSAAQLAERNAEMERRLQGLNETMDRRLSQLDTKVDRRLETASKTTTQVHERLVKLDEANAQMLERAKELSRLEHALRPPKARGGFGELMLENLLRDRLPATAYSLQYGFKSGERVDAVIRVSRMVPVDAKFPLDNFARLAEAQDTAERELHEKAFARDVKGHIDAIASKYIRPDEGTYEFAFMYLPSEAVYYELACGKTGELLQYAHERQIVPVSPSTFTAYLQMIVLGLKGMQIEEHAQEVMAYCAQLQKDFDRFKEDFDLVGTHLGRAQTKFVDADKRLDKFETKLDQAADSRELDAAGDVVAELPRAADAA